MPKIAMLEGYRGIPQERNSQRYAATTFCREFDDVMDRLKLAYSSAISTGVPASDIRLQTAAAFIKRESGIMSTWIAWGDACSKMVSEATRLLGEVNNVLREYRTPTIRSPESGVVSQSFTASITEPLTQVKWIVIGGAVLAGLFYLGPMIKFLAPKSRRSRR